MTGLVQRVHQKAKNRVTRSYRAAIPGIIRDLTDYVIEVVGTQVEDPETLERIMAQDLNEIISIIVDEIQVEVGYNGMIDRVVVPMTKVHEIMEMMLSVLDRNQGAFNYVEFFVENLAFDLFKIRMIVIQNIKRVFR